MSANQLFDVIVLGTGGVGSAAVYALARRGATVLGLDLHPAGHDRGSSHGQTRVIRQAYFEHPNYVPLVIASYDLWNRLEQATGQQLFTETGLIQAGPPDGEVVQGVLAAADQHQLDVEQIKTQEANARFAPLTFADQHSVLYERRAGYLLVERCVQAHFTAAKSEAATFVDGQRIVNWSSEHQSVRVTTATEDYTARNLIIALGPGTAGLWKLSLPLTVLRKHQYWYRLSSGGECNGNIPIYLVETGGDVFYGFPPVGGRGWKVARHTGGGALTENPITCASAADEAERRDDRALVERFLAEVLPSLNLRPASHSTCWYSMSADGHFYVGGHPHYDNVCIAAGLSGHGFKFTPVIGEALADLTLTGRTELPIQFLDPRRCANQ